MDPVHPAIDAYAEAHTSPPPDPLAEVVADTQERMPWPSMMSGLVEGRLFEALIAISGARRALEVGTFTGFGALTMAAALPDDGQVVTLEANEDTAAIARQHFERSEHGGKIELIVGDAREQLAKLDGPFDFVYIDAWKGDYIHYYEAALSLLSPRGVIVADNVLWGGSVLDESAGGEGRSVRAFNEHVQADERVHNVLLTVGDGLMLAWRR
ncbi:MAG TPA: O-methyltransferase [Thermoleophilaceae bacterium]